MFTRMSLRVVVDDNNFKASVVEKKKKKLCTASDRQDKEGARTM